MMRSIPDLGLDPDERVEAQKKANAQFRAHPDYEAVLCVLIGAKRTGPNQDRDSGRWLVTSHRSLLDCPIGPPKSVIFVKVEGRTNDRSSGKADSNRIG
jgi:hypothetical protein